MRPFYTYRAYRRNVWQKLKPRRPWPDFSARMLKGMEHVLHENMEGEVPQPSGHSGAHVDNGEEGARASS